ncbi:MAG: HAMP domain-containing histidine kinase [Actinobacteria bacterium]|nr:HAMP domain-containing histidine kinase [Actinomycetota bacterium]
MTLWYTSALYLSMAIIFSSFYIITKQTLFNYTDNILSSHASKVVEIVKKQNIGMHQYLADQGFLQEFSAIPGMLVVIMDSSGQTISGTVGIDPKNKLFKKLFNLALDTKKPFFNDQDINGSTMRFLVSPIEKNDKFNGVVLIAHPIDIIQMSLNRLLTIMGAVFLGLSILTILGGYFLANIGMQPVAALSNKLKKIEMENLEEQIINSHTGDEIEELTKTFNELLDRLREALKREHQFIVNVTHELKTPLAILQSSVELILSKKRSAKEYKKVFSEMLIDIKKASIMFNKILELAWSKAENVKVQGRVFDFSEFIAELQDVAKKMSLSKDITISGDITGGVKLFGEKDKLASSILNIIDNAIKFTPKHGYIRITLHNKNNVIVKVQDNGIGITREDLPYIFEPFYRGVTLYTNKGSGLGLAITQGIIKAHNGIVNVNSKMGKGTTVIVTLPTLKNPA